MIIYTNIDMMTAEDITLRTQTHTLYTKWFFTRYRIWPIKRILLANDIIKRALKNALYTPLRASKIAVTNNYSSFLL